MKERFQKITPLALSLLIHAVLTIWLLGNPSEKNDASSRWRGGGAIWVSVQELDAAFDTDPSENHTPTNSPKSIAKNTQTNAATKPKSPTPGNLATQNPGSGGNGTDADGGDAPSILARIRARIDQKKFMPLAATEQGLSGSVKVSFQITTDGQIATLKILKSSGHAILDEAALRTVQKSAPLPLYKKPIAIELEYQ